MKQTLEYIKTILQVRRNYWEKKQVIKDSACCEVERNKILARVETYNEVIREIEHALLEEKSVGV